MDEKQGATAGSAGQRWPDIAVRLVLAAIVIYWSFTLLQPFIVILIWAAILTVALYPIHQWLQRFLGGRCTLAAFLLTLVALVVILGPVSTIGTSLVKNLSSIAAGISEGTVTVPPPPPEVADWPLVGGRLSVLWQSASVELGETLESLGPQLREAARKLLGIVGNIGLGVMQFTVAIVIAGFAYNRAARLHGFLKHIAMRAAPQMGEDFVDLAGGTVRSVAQGVVGISIVQSILFGIGALVAGVPLAGLWTFVVLILTIVQVGPGLVILPIIILAWGSMDTVSAAVLTAYMLPVMLMDNVLKPLIMGRGLPVPMLVIFIGVVGGTLAHGLIGLFVGPVVLSLGYELGRTWMAMGRATSES